MWEFYQFENQGGAKMDLKSRLEMNKHKATDSNGAIILGICNV